VVDTCGRWFIVTIAMKRTRDQSTPVHEYRRLLHELEVHKVELEMQNQALRDDRDQLERSRARYAELYDFAPVGHLTCDERGTIVELNLSCASLLGHDRRHLQGKRLESLLAPASRSRLAAHVSAVLRDGGTVTSELTVPVVGGGTRTVELVSMSSPEPGGAGGPLTFHSVMADISARKRADQAKEDFLAVVSHELRTPLGPMILWTRALRTAGMNEAVRLRAVDAIEACVQAQAAMIDDLVDVARGMHGKLRVQRREVDLQPIVAAALEALAPSIAAKQLKVRLEVDPAPTWVTGDAGRLRQVAGNLLSNAVKFTREAGNVGVQLRTRDDHQVVFIVSDDGEGISPALLPEIFEPFRQHEDGAERRHGGLGLGLTIVRQLVEQHGGTVTAESAGPGRGAAFTVTLPRRQAPQPA
jgi:PAS domain S-box-containing protein